MASQGLRLAVALALDFFLGSVSGSGSGSTLALAVALAPCRSYNVQPFFALAADKPLTRDHMKLATCCLNRRMRAFG